MRGVAIGSKPPPTFFYVSLTIWDMNLYIENLLSEETAVTYGIKIFSNRDRMDMLKSFMIV